MARYIAARIEGPSGGSFESESEDDIRMQMLADGYSYSLSIYGLDNGSDSLLETKYFRAMKPNHHGWIPFLLPLSEEEGKRLESSRQNIAYKS